MKDMIMMKFATVALGTALIAATALGGCASVFDGGNQSVNLRPSSVGGTVNAKVTSKTGTQNIQLPGTISVDRDKSELLVTVDDPCYEKSQMSSSSSVNPWAIGNVLFGVFGLTGTTVDMNSGNAWKYDDTITVPTQKKPGCTK